GCITVHPESVSYFEDPPGEGFVRQVAEAVFDPERHFTVRNAAGRSVHLVAIDKCLIMQGTKRCDCVFYEGNDVYFVEFKLRAEDRDATDDRRIETRLTEAWEQLLTTVLLFEEQGFITRDHRISAYAYVGYGPIIPAPTTTILNLAEEFDNLIRFSADFDVKDSALF
ncbi:hypothetical protein, partial [Hymenobacter coccineus]|uniref:hypothetical protein n=1 Tax=Hymenobacter coccineus TaxID=1908235 RepID=UPI00195558A4